MFQIGITGGIGSGKSTITKIFEQLSVPVYNADNSAKWILNNDLKVRRSIEELFSENVYHGNQLDTRLVASMVFEDAKLLKKMNKIVHPAVAEHYDNWLTEQEGAYVLKEAAILFESGSYKSMDKVLVISAPIDLRIERVVRRDGVQREDVIGRMNNQWTEEQRLAKADFVIYNDESHAVIPQVMDLHKEILNLC